jgi:hypothetical protein
MSCTSVARLVLHGFDSPITLADGRTHRPHRRLALDLHRPAGTAACLLGPTGGGFERLCEETFQVGKTKKACMCGIYTNTYTKHQQQATARLTATIDGRLVREVMLERVALELGAGLLCNGTCSGSGPSGASSSAMVV